MLSWNKRGEASLLLSLSQEREERRRKIEMAEIDPLLTRPSSPPSVAPSVVASVRPSGCQQPSAARAAAVPHRELGGGRKISIACLFSFRRRAVWQTLSLSLPPKIKMGEDHASAASLLSHLIRAKEQFIQNKATTVLSRKWGSH